jgi:hypothetical protein
VNSSETNLQVREMIEIQCDDRWQVYHRLQALEISCCCHCYQPLKAHVTNATTAIQIWSVVRQATMPRQALVHWLENCWHRTASEREG